MIYKAALLSTLLVAGSAVSTVPTVDTEALADEDLSEFYTDIKSGKHSAKLLKSEKSYKKWVKFPEQLAAHSTAMKDRTRNLRAKKTDLSVVSHKDFFKTHAATFDLSDKVEMMVKDISPMTRTKTVRQRYEQYYDGVRVLTGDFIVNVGAHEGVLHAHGSSFSDQALKHTIADFERIKAKEADTAAIHAKVKDVLLKERGVSSSNAPSNLAEIKDKLVKEYSKGNSKTHAAPAEAKAAPAVEELTERDIELRDVTVELVVHPEWIGRGLTDSSLAYFVEGTAIVKGAFVSFQVSLDADSLESRLFIDQTNRFDASNVDDYSINLFSLPYAESDNLNHLWSSGGGATSTGNKVGNRLVDVSVQTANMLYSLSGGEFLGWNYTDTMMNVVQLDFEYNNAYFDGQWGIWFGPGLETDDIIGHEWGHGYTQTMNDLIYFEDSGALNEAFSDIIGESVDILNDDTKDSRKMRDLDPGECTRQAGGDDKSNRWAMGESSIFTAIRDMYNPECYNDPSSRRHPIYYYNWCFDSNDGFGVHTNSGIVNKVFSTMADGGVQIGFDNKYNVKKVDYSRGVGLDQAMNVIGQAYADLNWFSDYQDLAAAMENQCDMLSSSPSAAGYRPFLNERKVKQDLVIDESTCRRVKRIIKRANLFDSPANQNDCKRFCERNGCLF